MILTVTPQEVAGLRKGLARLIKHKRDNIRNIRRKMESEPSNTEANAIRIGMIERRLRSIVEAEGLLAQLILPPPPKKQGILSSLLMTITMAIMIRITNGT